MDRPVSTLEHNIMDFVTAGTLIAAPRLAGWEERAQNLMTAAAGLTLGYSLITRYEISLAKILQMKIHLTLDGIAGAAMLGAPLLLKHKKLGPVAAFLGIGAMEIALAFLTKTRPPFMIQMEPTISLPGVLPPQLSTAIEERVSALQGRYE